MWSSRVPVAAALLLGACAGDTSRTVLAPSPNPKARAVAIAIVSGNDQPAKAGERLDQPLVVRVTDAAGSGVGGVPVSFDVTGGGGLNGKDAPGPSRVSSHTDPSGTAQVWLEPYDVGRISVTALVEGAQVSPVTFTVQSSVVVIEFHSVRSAGDYAAFYGPCRCVRTINTVTVPVGTPVEWKSVHGQPYTVTSMSIPDGGIAFDSGTVTHNSRFRFVPSVTGAWEYHESLSGITATLKAK
jgi:hypothetical protein